ncbi:MAG: DUF4861 domain-containing protein [Prevotella sp.]
MRKNTLTLLLLILIGATTATARETTFKVTLRNTLSSPRQDVPVVIDLATLSPDILSSIGGREGVSSAMVTIGGQETPCQLDDLDDDAVPDELCFVTDMKKMERLTATVTLSDEGQPRAYEARTFASLSMRDRNPKSPKHLPITSLTVPAASNPYQYIFPHGPILESELVGFRIYADHRQSVDYYGHRQKQIELPVTQFYPTKEQKSTTFGDDVLYTGSTYGCGTLHGWDGKTSVMYENVRSRTYTMVSSGPVRAIIETVNRAWRMTATSRPVDVRTRYILYAGHRDVCVDVRFSRPVPDLMLSTGVTDIVGSEELTDKAGLRGCWGTAMAGNNPKVYDEHTVGLAVCVPKANYRGDAHFTDGKPSLPNQAYVALVQTPSDRLTYWFSVTCDMETFGFADSKAWFSYLKDWKLTLEHPVEVKVER